MDQRAQRAKNSISIPGIVLSSCIQLQLSSAHMNLFSPTQVVLQNYLTESIRENRKSLSAQVSFQIKKNHKDLDL